MTKLSLSFPRGHAK